MVLDGQIDHPTRDLNFDAPNATLGLKDVTGHLDPTAQGFDYTAKGQSRLVPFTSHGAILLPAGGQGRIAIAALDVSGTHASGALDLVTGGFAGAHGVWGAGSLEGRVVGRGVYGRVDTWWRRCMTRTKKRNKHI